MASAGTGGAGVIVVFNSQTVGEVRTITTNSPEAPKIDMSSHDTIKFRDFVGGLADRGSIQLEGILVLGDAGQDQLRSTSGDGASYAWSVAFPDGTGASGTGFVTSTSFAAPYSDAHTFSATIGMSGDVTFDTSGS